MPRTKPENIDTATTSRKSPNANETVSAGIRRSSRRLHSTEPQSITNSAAVSPATEKRNPFHDIHEDQDMLHQEKSQQQQKGEENDNDDDEEEEEETLAITELMQQLRSWQSVVPDETVRYWLARGGFDTPDPAVRNLVALMSEQFVSQLVQDAYDYHQQKSQQTASGGGRKISQRTTMTMEDLQYALTQVGISKQPRADYFF